LSLLVGATVFGLFLVVFGTVIFGYGVAPTFGALGLLFVIVAALVSALYTVGVSALGGWLGNYARYDLDI